MAVSARAAVVFFFVMFSHLRLAGLQEPSSVRCLLDQNGYGQHGFPRLMWRNLLPRSQSVGLVLETAPEISRPHVPQLSPRNWPQLIFPLQFAQTQQGV